VSFFDEGDQPTRAASRPSRPPRRRGGGGGPREPRPSRGGPDRRTLLVRQGVAVGVGVLLLILIVLGVKGCTDSRRENALKDYNRDVTAVVADSDRDVGRAFFQVLSSGSQQPSDLQVQVNELRLAADEDVKRARALDAPDDMQAADRNLQLVLGLRADGLRKIADALPTALGRGQPAEQAVERIAGQMQGFLASDVVYDLRVAPLIKQVLDGNGIQGQRIADSQFMNDISWLSPDTVAGRLGADATGSGRREVAPGTHGHGLSSVSVGETTLQPSPAVNRVAVGGGGATFTVGFENQGENDERNVRVTVTVRGGNSPITARKTVAQTKAGSPAEVEIPLGSAPPIGQAVTAEVVVVAVRGEEKTDNNRQRYTVIFTR
jgi:hypothetical protein